MSLRSAVVSSALLFIASACVTTSTPVPMRSVIDPNPVGEPRCVVVFLPGAGDHAETFAKEQFTTALRARPLSVELVSADATLGYYLSNVVVDRLEEDVIGPARARHPGAEVWLIGNSMGGHGTFTYPQRRPGQVTGVLALAPWVGTSVVKEVRAAGGLRAWTGDTEFVSGEVTQANFERRMWSWLKQATASTDGSFPEVSVGWGESDRLADDDVLVGDALPPERVFHTPGAHNWKTWRVLLAQFLDRSSFTKHCGASVTP